MTKASMTAAAVVSNPRLSKRDIMELRTLSGELQHDILAQYEDFVFRCKRQVDWSRWKAEKSNGSLHEFTERGADPSNKHSYEYPSRICIGVRSLATRGSNQPCTLITGTIVGTLDDAMYGATFQDTRGLQAIAAFTSLPESSIVMTLERGSHQDPYRFLGVTSDARDSLTLMSSGLARLSNGDQVGVLLRYSFQYDDTVEKQSFRAKALALTVFRQLDAKQIEVWSIQTERMTSGRRFHQTSSQTRMADLMLVCYGGLQHKLSWLIRRRRFVPLSHGMAIEPMSSGCSDACELCSRSTNRLFTRSVKTCRLCYKQTCSRCTVTHAVPTCEVSSKPVIEPMDFCVQCLLRSKSLSARELAQEELVFATPEASARRELSTIPWSSRAV